MSSKISKTATITGPKPLEPIITRTKSAQQRIQLRNKNKKTEKPKHTKPEIKSPKLKKSAVRSKESLLKNPVKNSAEVIEQVEYYPNKLKRDISTKKIMLKPKHNFKVIAATNKRKMATPQKGIKSPPASKKQKAVRGAKSLKTSITRPCSSPELSMQDMVRIMEESRSLSDEDFMEILTCPSPVWWEDPPDRRYDEESIHIKPSVPEKPNKVTKKRKIKNNTRTNDKNAKIIKTPKTKKNNKPNIIEQNKQEQQTNITVNKNDERYVKKKLKLESILGNIKKTIKKTDNSTKKIDDSKNEFKKQESDRNRKLSESEGDISDLSFNEDEILKNLENMDIPIENSVKNTNEDAITIKEESDNVEIRDELLLKNDNAIKMELEKPLIIKTETKDETVVISSVFDIDTAPDTNIQSVSDVSLGEINSNTDVQPDEVVIVDSCTNSSLGNNEDLASNPESVNKTSIEQDYSNSKDTNFTVFKKLKDLSEYITVYKITPDKNKPVKIPINCTQPTESLRKTKLDTVRGKLNDFFKQCKNNKRLKKNETTTPAILVTDVKETTDNEKENGVMKIGIEDEKNRLKSCDYCVEKTENGTTFFSCDKCELAPILPCDLCNFVADTNEIYRKHVSTCKDVARIPWNHNYLLNQT